MFRYYLLSSKYSTLHKTEDCVIFMSSVEAVECMTVVTGANVFVIILLITWNLFMFKVSNIAERANAV
jgi:hypothetical protein